MAASDYLPPLLSSLFRLAAYVFLQVIPSRLGKVVLPALYTSYLLSAWLADPGDRTVVHLRDKRRYDDARPRTSRLRDSLSTILLSLPTTSYRLNLTNIIINTLLLLATADFALTPFYDSAHDVVFTRVGAVYPDSVKIVARYPHVNNTELGTHIAWRESGSIDSWKTGPAFHFEEERDWVDIVRLAGLWPSTSYEYRISSLNGTFMPYPAEPIVFHTFPDPRLPSGNNFRFLVSSCIVPNFPYKGPFHRRSIKGFDLMADYIFRPSLPSTSLARRMLSTLESNEFIGTWVKGLLKTYSNHNVTEQATEELTEEQPRPAAVEFLLFLGDFIYADVPLYIGDTRDAYRRLYRRNYQSDSFRKIYERLPIFHAYDDHEIINNYAGNANDSNAPYPNASDGFKLYNTDANYDPPAQGETFYDFRHGDVAFFVMDTRRYRSDTDTDFNARTMLGDKQLASLYEWLSRVNGTSTFKFVVTSVPFTSLWGHDAVSDSWAGFPSEKAALLDAFHSVPNVIILSGDRHEFAAIEFSSGTGHTVREFSTSPLSMFYIPFVRTLRLKSENVVRKITGWAMPDTSDGEGKGLEAIYEDVPQERVMKYIAKGNYKWSAFEIDTRDLENPILRLETMIDGKAKYHFDHVGTPVKLHSSSAIGAFVAGGVKGVFDKIGIHPSKWF